MTKIELLRKLKAEDLYTSGKKLKEIAELANCSEATVSTYLKSLNVETRFSPGKTIFKVGEIIGNWKVLSEEIKESEGSNRSYCQYCECIRCGHKAWVCLMNKKRIDSNKCGKCKNSKLLNNDGTMNYDYVIKEYYFNQHIKRNLSRRSKVSTLEFSITPEYILDLFEKQGRKCAISGTNLDIRTVKSDGLILSLDRIDSNKGYIEGNVQWLHKDINMMKQSYSNEYFKEMCYRVAEQNGYSKCN